MGINLLAAIFRDILISNNYNEKITKPSKIRLSIEKLIAFFQFCRIIAKFLFLQEQF